MKKNKLSFLSVQEELLHREVSLFTLGDFLLIFDASPARTKYFLETSVRRGFLVRPRKGLYALKSRFPSEEEIAGALYRPSYISFEYAMGKHNIIPEMVYEITSATTKPTRTFPVAGKIFTYTTIKKAAFTGYSLVKSGTRNSYLADPEKSLTDYLYLVSLGKKSLNERLNLSRLNKNKVDGYAKLYDRPGLLKLIDKLCFPKK
jgi:predicted transcriptional regulator of viral defense system